jgi:hypothetical protein
MRLSDAARSVGANAKSTNILSDKVGRIITVPSLVRLLAAASAAGLRISVLLGAETVVDDQEISRANRYPIYPDDVVQEFGVTGPNDELYIFLRNTTAAAITADTVVDISPVE